MKPKYSESKTTVIKRSKINFAPYNPKIHSIKDIEIIGKNIKRVGLLGGIIVNSTTMNLVDGHKCIMAMDKINKYEGPESDYDVKVEMIEMDEKTEKEQNIFQSSSRTDFDTSLLNELINAHDLDPDLIGMTKDEAIIMELEMPSFINEIKKNENVSDEEKQKKKEDIIAKKEKTKTKTEAETYLIINFNSFEEKAFFLEDLGLDIYKEHISGVEFEKHLKESYLK